MKYVIAIVGLLLSFLTITTLSAVAATDPSADLTITVEPPAAIPLSNGNYQLVINGLAPDVGFYPPIIGVFSTAGNQINQTWIWNGSTIQSMGLPGNYLKDNSTVDGPASIVVVPATQADTWTIVKSGTTGYIIFDTTTKRYMGINGTTSGAPGALVMETTQISSMNWIWTTVAITPPHSTAITLTPMTATVYDNMPIGTILSTASVTMSDGSQFTGTLLSSDNSGFFAISGLNIVTGQTLTPAEDGSVHTTIITPSQ